LVCYCDRCGSKIDHRERYCRICGGRLHRPSILWRTRRAVFALLRPHKPTPDLELPIGSTSPVVPPTVKAEKGKAPKQGGLEEGSIIKSGVLEKAFITNRKSGATPTSGAIARLRRVLTKSATKLPAASSEVEAKMSCSLDPHAIETTSSRC
jgi:hypothetical protein